MTAKGHVRRAIRVTPVRLSGVEFSEVELECHHTTTSPNGKPMGRINCLSCSIENRHRKQEARNV